MLKSAFTPCIVRVNECVRSHLGGMVVNTRDSLYNELEAVGSHLSTVFLLLMDVVTRA